MTNDTTSEAMMANRELLLQQLNEAYEEAHEAHLDRLDSNDAHDVAVFIDLVRKAKGDTCAIDLPQRLRNNSFLSLLEESKFWSDKQSAAWGGDDRAQRRG